MGKIRREPKKQKLNKGSKTVTPGAAQGLVFNTSGYGQHILKNPQVVQVPTQMSKYTKILFGLVRPTRPSEQKNNSFQALKIPSWL